MTFKDYVLTYCYRQAAEAENRYNELRNFNRYHNVDEVDMLELIIAKTRRDTTAEFVKDIYNMLTVREKSALSSDNKTSKIIQNECFG